MDGNNPRSRSSGRNGFTICLFHLHFSLSVLTRTIIPNTLPAAQEGKFKSWKFNHLVYNHLVEFTMSSEKRGMQMAVMRAPSNGVAFKPPPSLLPV